MMIRILATVFTATLALGVSAAAAQTTVADTDGDGVFSMAEMQVAYPDLTPETFADMDVDGSAMIDADELQAAREQGFIAN